MASIVIILLFTDACVLDNFFEMDNILRTIPSHKVYSEYLFLYNADPAFAEVFINHNIKAHFSLSAGDVKALPTFQKEMYKAFISSREARRERGGDRPEWYEEGERGGLRFLPGVLAEHMAANVNAFFAAEQYYFYENDVYTPKSDLQAQALTRSFMISRYALSAHISDAENQWKMLIIKPIREINVNPYLIKKSPKKNTYTRQIQ